MNKKAQSLFTSILIIVSLTILLIMLLSVYDDDQESILEPEEDIKCELYNCSCVSIYSNLCDCICSNNINDTVLIDRSYKR